MNKKYIAGAFLFVLIGCLILLGSWFYVCYRNSANVRGNHVFANTRNNMEKLSSVKITAPDNSTITLYREDGVWKFKEANDYFANTDAISNFFYMVYNSIIYDVNDLQSGEKEKYGLDENHATLIRTFSEDGQLLDEVVFGANIENSEYRAASNPLYKNRYYKITAAGGFSDLAFDWIPYPLLNINKEQITGLVTSSGKINKAEIDSLQQRFLLWHRFIEALGFIDYHGITLKSDLQNTPHKVVSHRFDVIMIGGLIYQFDVYNTGNSYWLGITLKTEKIARKEVFPFVLENQKYFSDWLFHLNSEQGQLFFEVGREVTE